ncbi:conserved oligomeric Golgi complex subunit 5 [Zeugodacus cucurbitae]|uniref:conserved oligomeric Golgi complex subunit 5 n=1 Tax=Zeugodacus cucurbitae TaxID=28588 RepID=UPI00059686E2|nr:conserved oligomeric Golgi complex subunit 5 [Zeugodacus cucurbitae]
MSNLELDNESITNINANTTIQEQIQELTKRLQNVNDDLHQQVREKHDALLQQATHAGRFDVALNTLASDVEQIRGTGQKLKRQIDTQYQQVDNQTRILGRLHELSHLLRSTGTLLSLTAKLRSTKDVLKQAELHFELGQLFDDEDLKKIDFVQNARTEVISSRQKLRNLTQMQLVTGLQERNEALVINSLKIVKNFNLLQNSLDNLVATFISDLEQSLKECFAGTDITILSKSGPSNNVSPKPSSTIRGPGKTPMLTTTQNFRAKFWKSLHWLLYEELYESCEQVNLLKRALDQIRQFGFDAAEIYNVHDHFWHAVQELFRKSFSECPVHVTQTLQEGLAKLLSSARGFEQRLNGEFLFDNEMFSSLEIGYISKCAANMKACLAGVDLPSNETVDAFIRVASTELSAALIDARLTNSVGAVFIACGKELCTKLESQIKLGPDSKQVVDIPNFQQTQNVILANILYYYKDSVRRMLADMRVHFSKSKSSAHHDILKALEQTNILIGTILQQIVDSILSTISIILLSMHREPGLSSEKISTAGPSMYMKELQEFISRVWLNHIGPFEDKELVTKCGHEVAKRCIELFVHNMSILRPISDVGRQRLKNDCNHMEHALKPICANLPDLGNSARLLRAMSFLIVQPPQELVKQSVGNDSLVPSYIVLFLLFGHASADLQSPHTTANWSNERLLEWLDGHTSDREKLELISGALQRYRDQVRRKKSEQYDAVYPLMVEFFEKSLKS